MYRHNIMIYCLMVLLMAACDSGEDNDNNNNNNNNEEEEGQDAAINNGEFVPGDLIGKWAIVGELVTSSAEDPLDPLAPKPGQVLTDSWTIAQTAQGLSLTTPKGVIDGQGTADGGHFEVTFELSAGLWCQVIIDCYLQSPTTMIGTEEINYFSLDAVNGQPYPVAKEAWKFEGAK